MIYRMIAGSATLLAILAGMTGCTNGREGRADSAVANAATTADSGIPAKADTGMAGMNEAPTRDADQEFLRMMVDHHQGMIAMADSAAKSGSAHIKGDAADLSSAQKREQQWMLGTLKSGYSEDKMPMVRTSSTDMLGKLTGKTGAEFDRQFRLNVIAHHEEAIGMIDKYMPRLTRADVKKLAEKMKADQTSEIADFRKELEKT